MNQRQQLVQDLARNAAEIAGLELEHARMLAAALSSNADDEHDPEGATIAFEREQLSAQLARARRTRSDLQRAVEELDRGRYGSCERCGEQIDPARLEARSHTRWCIECAQASARGRR